TRRSLGRLRDAVRSGEVHPALLVSGLGGAVFVAGQSIASPAIGVALFTVGTIGGPLVVSLIGDRFRLGAAGPRALASRRVAATCLAVAAVLVTVSDRVQEESFDVPAMGLAIFAGIVVAVYMPLSGRISVAARSSLVAVWLSTVVASAGLAV